MVTFSLDVSLYRSFRVGERHWNLELAFSLPLGGRGALFGPSGAGKTTVLRLIAGLTPLEKGYVRFGNQVWQDTETGEFCPLGNRRIGFLFQDYALFPHMKVWENVAFGLREDTSLSTVDEWLEKVGLYPLRERYPKSLSGGEKQRLAFARTLASEPQLLLLDEPFSSVDGETKERLMTVLEEYCRQREVTLLLVSHSVEEVVRLTEQIFWIREGRLWREGSPTEVFTTPQGYVLGKVVKVERGADRTNVFVLVDHQIFPLTLAEGKQVPQVGDLLPLTPPPRHCGR